MRPFTYEVEATWADTIRQMESELLHLSTRARCAALPCSLFAGHCSLPFPARVRVEGSHSGSERSRFAAAILLYTTPS